MKTITITRLFYKAGKLVNEISETTTHENYEKAIDHVATVLGVKPSFDEGEEYCCRMVYDI